MIYAIIAIAILAFAVNIVWHFRERVVLAFIAWLFADEVRPRGPARHPTSPHPLHQRGDQLSDADGAGKIIHGQPNSREAQHDHG